MSRFPVFTRSLLDLRWSIFWYGVGLGIYGAAMVLLFPTFEEALGDFEYPEEILAFFGGGNLSDPAFFINVEFYGFAVLILMIYGVIAGTGMLAGEEGRGTLETLLAQPVRRSRLMIEKGAALLAGAVLICAVVCLGWLAVVPFVDLHGEVTLLQLVGATFGMLPGAALFLSLGLLLGAIAPSRGAAAGILAGVTIVAYLVASLAEAIGTISWMRYLSPYYYTDAARYLTDGPVWWHQLALVVATLVVFALAIRAFEGREIAAGRWQPLAWLPSGAAAADA